MKILQLTPSVTEAGGGVSEAVRLLSLGLSGQADAVVEVFALDDGPGDAMVGEWSNVPVRSFPFRGTPRWKLSPALLAATMRARADVIHVHGLWQFHDLAALLASVRHGTPLVVSPHGMLEPWILARSRSTKMLVSRLYQDRMLARTAAFHVLTEKEAGDVCAVVPGAPCRVIPNFVRREDASAWPAWWRPAWVGRTVFGFIGRMHEKKGVLELCDAWENACETQPGFRDGCALALCGPNEIGETLDGRIEALTARLGNIAFAGPQFGDNKWRSLRAFDYLCLPSRSEGLPITILEGWAAGIPSLMSRECNLSIGFERGASIESGFMAEPIGRALLEAWRIAPDTRFAMGARAKRIVAERFSEQAVIGAMLGLYADVLTRAGA